MVANDTRDNTIVWEIVTSFGKVFLIRELNSTEDLNWKQRQVFCHDPACLSWLEVISQIPVITCVVHF